MTLKSLPVTKYEKIISRFIPQTRPDMCYSASITNIINELGIRNKVSSMKFSLKVMNNKCGYKEGFQCNEQIVPSVLCELLKPFEYRFDRTFGDKNDISILKKIASDKQSSYPLISVSPRYFDEIDITTMGRNRLDHSLIILGVNHDIIYFYDPYEKFIQKSSRCQYKPRNLDKVILTGIWDEAELSRCIEWIEPLEYTQERLYSERFISK